MSAAPAPAKAPPDCLLREVRLGLVLNGGVSLAVWIGGVTHEIDCIRRAREAPPAELAVRSTSLRYKELLKILRERVVVDVVAGASAGGINGALLAAAVYAQRPLPLLRDVWITIGDFTKLLRSPAKREPPSLLLGERLVLPQLEQHFKEILAGATKDPADSIYLYVTATDFYGVAADFADSTGRRFRELEHRRVFRFQHPPPTTAGAKEETAVEEEAAPEKATGMPEIGTFDLPNAARLLAEAARSSSSFPVAFEAHGMMLDEDKLTHWMIDGGILDNQPFNPVLNRIATINAGAAPVRRVVGYIVPYVTETGGPVPKEPPQPTAVATATATGPLARDLPKLDGLKRIRTELGEARRVHAERRRFDEAGSEYRLAIAAEALFDAYKATRHAECLETFAEWAAPGFQPGAGELGQAETIDPREAVVPRGRADGKLPDEPVPWLPEGREWGGGDWGWGLSPSERIAAEALAGLRSLLFDAPCDEGIREAKGAVAGLVHEIRALKFLVSVAFQKHGWIDDLVERAIWAYDEAHAAEVLSTRFEDLSKTLAKIDGAPSLQRLIDEEIVRNALGAQRLAVPAAFEFVHMSAGIRNSLGHAAATPQTKLAGMKLSHFAGFLKRSWRANDWLWGRLDGVEYLVASVLDRHHLETCVEQGIASDVFSDLGSFAFPTGDADVLGDAWRRTVNFMREQPFRDEATRAGVLRVLDSFAGAPPRTQFCALLYVAATEGEPHVCDLLLRCCVSAVVARIQLEILTEELPEVARAVKADLRNGASRGSSGADWAARPTGATTAGRVASFTSLRIGSDEGPVDEASSKLGMDVVSTAAAVAAAAFSGGRGGLPRAIRAPLAAMRGITLVLNVIVRLLVRTPAFGMAAVVAAGVPLVWALVAPSGLLGSILPALVAIVVGGTTVLIAMATSPLEARCRTKWQGVGLAAIVVVPALVLTHVLALPFGWTADVAGFDDRPLETGAAFQWLNDHSPESALEIARVFVLAALGFSLLRLAAGWIGHRFRVVDLWLYRWALLGATAAVGAGLAYQEIHDGGHSWKGTIPFLLLVGAISLAPLFAELGAGFRWFAERAHERGLRTDVLQFGIWLLFIALLIPAAVVGWVIGRR